MDKVRKLLKEPSSASAAAAPAAEDPSDQLGRLQLSDTAAPYASPSAAPAADPSTIIAAASSFPSFNFDVSNAKAESKAPSSPASVSPQDIFGKPAAASTSPSSASAPAAFTWPSPESGSSDFFSAINWPSTGTGSANPGLGFQPAPSAVVSIPPQVPPSIPSWKILLVGDGGVGMRLCSRVSYLYLESFSPLYSAS